MAYWDHYAKSLWLFVNLKFVLLEQANQSLKKCKQQGKMYWSRPLEYLYVSALVCWWSLVSQSWSSTYCPFKCLCCGCFKRKDWSGATPGLRPDQACRHALLCLTSLDWHDWHDGMAGMPHGSVALSVSVLSWAWMLHGSVPVEP